MTDQTVVAMNIVAAMVASNKKGMPDTFEEQFMWAYDAHTMASMVLALQLDPRMEFEAWLENWRKR